MHSASYSSHVIRAMQYKLSPQCIDSNLCSLNEHLVSANLASDCCAPPDDVEIATGQASFDDGDIDDEMSTAIDSHPSRGMVEDLDDVFPQFDYEYVQMLQSLLSHAFTPLLTRRSSSIQSHSAPARGWDIGRFERSDSRAALQCEGSSSVKESEPWSHLQTFDLSPEPDDRSSQDFQIETSSQWSSSLQDSDMLHHPIINPHHRRQAPARNQRMQENPFAAEGDVTQRSRLQNPAGSTQSVPLPNSSVFEHGFSYTGGPHIWASSPSSTFSQPAMSGLPMESGSAPFFDTQSAYPLHHSTINEMKRSNTGLSQDHEIGFALNRGLIDEPGHYSLRTSEDVLTPQELSWRRHDHFLFEQQLSPSADTECGSYDFGLTAHDHPWPPDFVQDPALGFTDSNTLDHPGAIKIGGSSGHYRPDLPSSFPPSADCFPVFMPTIRNRAISSSSEPTVLSPGSSNLPFRRNSRKSTSARASRSGSLSIIRENGHSQQGSPNLSRNGSGKGKRKGPLPTATALAAAQKRKEGSVCIRCRTMKMTVGRCSRIIRELANYSVVQRGPSVRGVSTGYEGQTLGPVLHPCEFHRYGKRGYMQRNL